MPDQVQPIVGMGRVSSEMATNASKTVVFYARDNEEAKRFLEILGLIETTP